MTRNRVAAILLAAGLTTVSLAAHPFQSGALAASEPHAVAAGAAVLADGGNAVDAAVATAFALAVTLPYAGNLGGGGFLIYRAPSGDSWFLDFRETAPAAAHAALYQDDAGVVDKQASKLGWKAVGVPGSVPGLLAAHEKWGRLPLQRLLEPAIRLAADGVEVSPDVFRRLRGSQKLLARDPLALRTFLHSDGTALVPGDVIVQPELAATLRAIASRGADAFRDGPIVEGIVSASQAGGGLLTAADLRDYQPVLRPVHRFEWNGLEILAASPPSSGGVFLQQSLAMLSGRLWRFDDARTVQAIGEATARAFRDRNQWLGDPAGFDFDLSGLTNPEYLERLRREVSGRRYTPPARLGGRAVFEPSDTTHLSVADGEGGAVALTTTLNGIYGAKVMAPGGFLMNNEMDDFAAAPGSPNMFGLVQGDYNAVRAGRRPLSSMCPVIVVEDGRVDAVIGSPGGSTILTSVLQVLLNRYTFRMPPRAAVAAPRFHRQDRPPHLEYEAGRLDLATMSRLRQLGQPLKIRPNGIGDVNAVFRWSDGWTAVSDPRRGGAAQVVEPAPR